MLSQSYRGSRASIFDLLIVCNVLVDDISLEFLWLGVELSDCKPGLGTSQLYVNFMSKQKYCKSAQTKGEIAISEAQLCLRVWQQVGLSYDNNDVCQSVCPVCSTQWHVECLGMSSSSFWLLSVPPPAYTVFLLTVQTKPRYLELILLLPESNE